MKKQAIFWLTLLLIGVLTGCKVIQTTLLEEKKLSEVVRDYTVNSNNIVMNKAGNMIYIANIDVNTVTIVDSKTKEVKAEIPVGNGPSHLTLSPDEKSLYISCRYDNQIDVISIEKEKIIDSIDVGIEPYGVITSQNGQKLYVANYRSSTISVIDLSNKEIESEIKVDDRPRTLAITADGKKLYAPHYLYSAISVINLETNKVTKVIKLADSLSKNDRKKSQGIPNTLEQFVISPDGKKAWIPHLLTNIDTPIHFQETIFPAISVIDLTKDEEIMDERKELFQEINVTDKKNETIIVSNPYDVVFQPNVSKAYVVMSGSEDLVVFDLKRGGNATQILRRIDGNNPRGAVISPNGETIYVHNAMSHDLVEISTGGDSPYSRAKLSGESIKLISKDSLSPLVREGKTIFYSANSEEFATEITGNNWVSCVSCHSDGDINQLTLMTPKGPRNVPSNTLTTKTGLFMWDGSRDDFTDYLLTVQGEMGGMTEFDPKKPLPKDIEHMYDAMFAYLDDPDSFPIPKSPYRKKDRSLSPTAEEGRILFEGKAGCIACHAENQFTDSVKAINQNGYLTTDNTSFLHDIGTSNPMDKPSKGDPRAGFTNPRDSHHFDVPTLRGVWATAPYLHDGSANTVEEVIKRIQYEEKPLLTDGEIFKIAEYVRSIE